MADNETIDKVFELAGQLANELEEIAEIRHVDGNTELIFTKDAGSRIRDAAETLRVDFDLVLQSIWTSQRRRVADHNDTGYILALCWQCIWQFDV